MKYIASWSGGKDSTASIILAHENNEPLDLIVFSEVMFDKNISGELPEHIDFIKNKCIPLFESWGYEVKILHSEKTYLDVFYRRKKKGKNAGKIYGFPPVLSCWANGELKMPPVIKFWKLQDEDVTQYVGIAIDEPKRLERIAETKNKISLLEKYGYTEQMAKEKCEEYNLLSPIYALVNRGGCWFCQNQTIRQLKVLRDKHPDLWEIMLNLQKDSPYPFGIDKPIDLLEERFSWEDRQIDLFDCGMEEVS